MDKTNFSDIRRKLGLTQQRLAQMMGISIKAVQSFEQGWRLIPAYVERQMLYLQALHSGSRDGNKMPCWEYFDCPPEARRECPAYQLQGSAMCWFVNGLICRGKACSSWREKMENCENCEFFKSLVDGEGPSSSDPHDQDPAPGSA